MNKSNLTGFVLIFAIMMGFSWYQARQRNKQLEAQYQLDSIARVEQMAAMAMDSMKRAQGIVPENEVTVKTMPAYKEALNAKFPHNGRGNNRRARGGRPALSEKERLIQKYHQLEQDIVTYENNIGFFSMSKNSAPLVKQMEDRIAQSKEELKALAEQIRVLTETEEQD